MFWSIKVVMHRKDNKSIHSQLPGWLALCYGQ